jgi:hypothetical protein
MRRSVDRLERLVGGEAAVARLHDEMVEDVILHRLGERLGLAPTELGAIVAAWQAETAAGVARDERLISNLRGVVGALGGRLRLQAVFADGKLFEIVI